MFFTTENSTYEVDRINNRIRKVKETNYRPQSSLKIDKWKSYISLSPVIIGHNVYILWDAQSIGRGKVRIHNTQTTKVLSISP